MTRTDQEVIALQRWNGSYVTGSHPAVVVRYAGPTNSRGSRWLASLKRDSETTWRAAVPFQEGPIAAAEALLAKQGLDWHVVHVSSIDADTYSVGVS